MTKKTPHLALVAWLEKENLSQTELANHLNVSRCAVSRICHGKIYPSRTTAAALAIITDGEIPEDIWPRSDTSGWTRAAKIIREKLAEKRISISEAARRAEVPQPSFYKYYTSDVCPTEDRIAKINKGLGLKLTPNDFMVPA